MRRALPPPASGARAARANPVIDTERLTLRRWREDDAEAYAEICADPAVMRWIGDGSVRTPGQCAEAILQYEAWWDGQGFGLFAAKRRADGKLLGFVGFLIPDFLPEISPAVEIGWRLSRAAWGQGLATEGARAAIAFAWTDLALERLVSVVQTGNTASERVCAKLGMTPWRETVIPGHGCRARVYEIRR